MPKTYFCLYLSETEINTVAENTKDHKVINYAKYKTDHQERCS